MKIGILTVPFNNNFGGFLQAYALKRVLNSLGHDVIFINRRRNKSRGWRGAIKDILLKIGILKNLEKKLSINTEKFIQRYLTPGTPYYFSSKELRKCLSYDFDMCVVGSDQVWRYRYAQDSIDDFFFSFLKNTTIPRISYAASFGTDSLEEYPEDKKNECTKLLTSFSGLSVREKSGIKLLQELGIRKDRISVVLDPTLLLTKEDYYDSLIKDYNIDRPARKYIFNYILDNSTDKEQLTDRIAKSLGYEVIRLKAQTETTEQVQPIACVEEWLHRIYHSDFVITDSFHGTVFSILFNKPFIVIGNKSRGLTRFKDLLTMIGLEHRMIESTYDFKIDMINGLINWYYINSLIKRQREISLNFLTQNLATVQ